MIKQIIEDALQDAAFNYHQYNDQDLAELAQKTTDAVRKDIEEGIATIMEIRCNGLPG